MKVSSGVISGGSWASRQRSHTRTCSGYVISGASTASAVRKSSHGGVAPRSRKLRSCADPQSRQVRVGSVAAAVAWGAVSVSIRSNLRSGRPPPRARLSARGGVFHAPRTVPPRVVTDGGTRHTGRDRGRVRRMPDMQGMPRPCIEPILADVTRPGAAHRRRTWRDARRGRSRASWDHEKPVRRGVMAAPRILVPMVQVRILAAERLVRAVAHDREARADSNP